MKVQQKPTILILLGYYLPGVKAGGPLQTISNMVNLLSDYYYFKIITRDRDLGDSESYPNIIHGEWNVLGKAQVYYMRPNELRFYKLNSFIKNTHYDFLYLNSFFDSVFTIKVLLGKKMNLINDNNIVLAPRGEFSKGALGIKRFKKYFFLCMIKPFGFLNKLTFHASTNLELQDIKNALSINENSIITALNLPSMPIGLELYGIDFNKSSSNQSLRIIFLSRITPKKNLHFALEILSRVVNEIKFDIYGPKEDEKYWKKCCDLISKLPNNISVSVLGSINHDDIYKTFAQYDLFFFPTQGENYGHVIAESLLAGTPVLLSDQTPWRNMNSQGFGWDINLNNENEFVKIIENFQSIEKRFNRKNIHKTIKKLLLNPEIINANKSLFKK
ncbi:glycosyltransferase [Polaribacter sp.]|uniref:glycosyltransferase n=1 Tax=Polaribacter sp. TaxID=1920175 RepID=UPI0040484227